MRGSNDQVLKTDPEMPLAALPTCTPAAGAGDSPDVPFKEPADPEAAGSKLGYQDGCTTAFELNDKPLGNICFNR